MNVINIIEGKGSSNHSLSGLYGIGDDLAELQLLDLLIQGARNNTIAFEKDVLNTEIPNGSKENYLIGVVALMRLFNAKVSIKDPETNADITVSVAQVLNFCRTKFRRVLPTRTEIFATSLNLSSLMKADILKGYAMGSPALSDSNANFDVKVANNKDKINAVTNNANLSPNYTKVGTGAGTANDVYIIGTGWEINIL